MAELKNSPEGLTSNLIKQKKKGVNSKAHDSELCSQRDKKRKE